jgi:hypothetical protein
MEMMATAEDTASRKSWPVEVRAGIRLQSRVAVNPEVLVCLEVASILLVPVSSVDTDLAFYVPQVRCQHAN